MKISAGAALLNAVMGYAVVFVGLILLMVVVLIMGKLMSGHSQKKKAPETPAAPAVIETPPLKVVALTAPGSAGEVKRFDVPDKEAAMLMAIVADKMGKPLNELRFKSIREVK